MSLSPEKIENWIAAIFCLRPGFPGHFSNTQVFLIFWYLLLVANTFVMFTLSLQHVYALYTPSVNVWLALSLVQLVLSSSLMSFYFMMMLGVNKPTGAVIFDLPRFWLACIATMLSSHTTVVILFVYLYTQNHQSYLELLNQGFQLSGYYSFMELRMLDFLAQCQLNAKFVFMIVLLEYIFFAARKPLSKWLQQ